MPLTKSLKSTNGIASWLHCSLLRLRQPVGERMHVISIRKKYNPLTCNQHSILTHHIPLFLLNNCAVMYGFGHVWIPSMKRRSQSPSLLQAVTLHTVAICCIHFWSENSFKCFARIKELQRTFFFPPLKGADSTPSPHRVLFFTKSIRSKFRFIPYHVVKKRPIRGYID